MIQPVDPSPITFTQFVEQGQKKLALITPLAFTPVLSKGAKQLYVIRDESMNIHVYATTREALMNDLKEQLFFLWDTFGSDEVDPKTLDQGALACRNELRKRLREA